MPTVADVLGVKGGQLHSVSPATSVLDAIRKMNQHKIGALLVTQGDQVAGIFTERDVLRRVVGDEKNPATTKVGQVMTSKVVCCDPDADLDEVAAIMQQKKIRHIPVCDEDGLHGMISIGDLNAFHASSQEAQIHFLSEYIYGRV